MFTYTLTKVKQSHKSQMNLLVREDVTITARVQLKKISLCMILKGFFAKTN
jgi:hypothetical protein